MITITRIAGESYNLQTGEQMPKALILSNGIREYSLYVDDHTAKDILSLLLEVSQESTASSAPVGSEPSQEKRKVPSAEDPVIPSHGSRSQIYALEHATYGGPLEAPQPPPMAVIEGDDPDTEEEYGLEPGEEYNDPATGAASL